MLEARNLGLWRGTRCLFEDLSFKVPAGRALLVRGANGTGKTTLLRVLCGLTRPEYGQVCWQGEDIEQDRAGYGGQLAYWGHLGGLKVDLTVGQNLMFLCRINGLDDAVVPELIHSLSLAPCADLPVRHLSAGQKRRAGMAAMLMSRASVWLMDEPFTNLDDNGRNFLLLKLEEHLQREGIAVVAAHHELDLPGSALGRVVLGACP